jgi:hypothetical protein
MYRANPSRFDLGLGETERVDQAHGFLPERTMR